MLIHKAGVKRDRAKKNRQGNVNPGDFGIVLCGDTKVAPGTVRPDISGASIGIHQSQGHPGVLAELVGTPDLCKPAGIKIPVPYSDNIEASGSGTQQLGRVQRRKGGGTLAGHEPESGGDIPPAIGMPQINAIALVPVDFPVFLANTQLNIHAHVVFIGPGGIETRDVGDLYGGDRIGAISHSAEFRVGPVAIQVIKVGKNNPSDFHLGRNEWNEAQQKHHQHTREKNLFHFHRLHKKPPSPVNQGEGGQNSHSCSRVANRGHKKLMPV